MKKKFLAWLLSAIMAAAAVPTQVWAADATPAAGQDVATASVSYDGVDRKNATITYHRPGLEAPDYNLVFLADVSSNARESVFSLQKMLKSRGDNLLMEFAVQGRSVQFIPYKDMARDESLGIVRKYPSYLLGTPLGEGTTDEINALNSAIGSVRSMKTQSPDTPVVVYWVPGDHWVQDETAIREKLVELTGLLDEAKGDALITWQQADAPDALLAEFATKYTPAHETQPVTAAFAESSAALFQDGMAESLEKVVHDRYHNVKFQLNFTSGQTIIDRVTSVYASTDYNAGEVSAQLSANGKAIEGNMEDLCAQAETTFTVKVRLDAEQYDEQQVLDAVTVLVNDNGTNGRLCTGAFDQNTDKSVNIGFPAVSLDRSRYAITYQDSDGAEVDKTRAISGQIVKILDGTSVLQPGKRFSGWNVTGGDVNANRFYYPGEILAMPKGNMALSPSYGQTAVKLEVGEFFQEPTGTGNQMADNAAILLNFSEVEINGQVVGKENVQSLYVIDQEIIANKVADPNDPNRVDVSGSVPNAVYARQIGARKRDNVVAYLVPNANTEGVYDLYIAGAGGVKAPAKADYLFGIKPSYDYTTQINFKQIDLTALDTTGVTSMKGLFSWNANLASITFGDRFDTSQVTDMSEMFYRCQKLQTLDLSRFDTSRVEKMTSMFDTATVQNLVLPTGFVGSATTNTATMFNSAKVSQIDASSWNMENVTKIGAMFSGCRASRLNITGWNLNSVQNCFGLFREMINLREITGLSTLKLPGCSNMGSMFSSCSKLTSLELGPDFSTKGNQNFSHMFSGLAALTTLDLSQADFDTEAARDFSSMFSGSPSLKTIILGDKFHCHPDARQDMTDMFSNLTALETLKLGANFQAAPTKTTRMFEGCKSLKTLDLTGLDLDIDRTSSIGFAIYDAASMFEGCSSLESITTGTQWYLGKADSLSSMFNGCYSLKSIGNRIHFGGGNTNYIKDMSYMFYNCSSLTGISMYSGQFGRFGRLETMRNMFYGCSSLTSIDMDNWGLEKLTNVAGLFSGCRSLKSIRLNWTSMKADAGNFQTTDMFYGVPADATLKLQIWGYNAPAPELKSKIQAEFDNRRSAQYSSEEEDEDFVVYDLDEEGYEDEFETYGLDEDYDYDFDYDNDVELYDAAQDDNVIVHDEATPAGTHFAYKIRVQYTGDPGARSGRIALNFPLPENVKADDDPHSDAADPLHGQGHTTVMTGAVQYIAGDTGWLGGRILEEPKLVEEGGKTYVRGVFEGLYAGNEFEVTVHCINEDTVADENGYMKWDGIATAVGDANTAVSAVYRLWNKDNTPTPPAVDTQHRLVYQFTGEIPADAVLPGAQLVKENDPITLADAPTTAEAGYTFDGWYDGTALVAPGSAHTMTADLTLTGKWTLDATQAEHVTVRYRYDGTEPAGAPVIGVGSALILAENTVTVGQQHTLPLITFDVNQKKFMGWTPTLSIDGADVPLTKAGDEYTGTYDGATYRIPVEGQLLTEQFRGAAQVEILYTGAWRSYSGTVAFAPNGGTGTMADWTDVAVDTTDNLPDNQFTLTDYQFAGWALSPDGNVAYENGAPAAGLIRTDGETVTLYAKWLQNEYDVACRLTGVTSSNQATKVAAGSAYTTTLTVPPYYGLTVKVTMNGVDVTADVYDEATKTVNVARVTGNLIITATGIAPIEHTITVQVTGGTATPNGAVSVIDGTDLTVRFAPNREFMLESAQVDGQDVTLTADNSYTFTGVTDDHTIEVVFKARPVVDDGLMVITARAGEGGKISPSGKVEVSEYNDQTFTMTPDAGYRIADVTVDGESVGAVESYTFPSVRDNHTIVVTFVKNDDTTGTNPGGGNGGGSGTNPGGGNGGGSGTNPGGGNGGGSGTNPGGGNGDSSGTNPGGNVADPVATGVAELLDVADHKAYLFGYEDGSFGPERLMTRAEVSQMFYNLLNEKNVTVTTRFADVAEDAWYARAVHTLAALGIVEGVGNGKFEPERKVTRAEFAALAVRFAKANPNGSASFTDVAADAWYYEAVQTATNYGWIAGYADGTFRPQETITRAEVTSLTNRMLGRAVDAGYVAAHSEALKTFADVAAEYWGYGAIMEATNSHRFVKSNGVESWSAAE